MWKKTVKLSIFIVALLFLASCYNYSSPVVEESNEYVRVTVHKYEYGGHKYQVHYIDAGSSRAERTGVVHDPDCTCFKDSIR